MCSVNRVCEAGGGRKTFKRKEGKETEDLLSAERLFYVWFLEADNVPWPWVQRILGNVKMKIVMQKLFDCH